jgi:hypothetical protein
MGRLYGLKFLQNTLLYFVHRQAGFAAHVGGPNLTNLSLNLFAKLRKTARILQVTPPPTCTNKKKFGAIAPLVCCFPFCMAKT